MSNEEAQQQQPKHENSLGELMRFFSTDERKVGSGEFREFWDSLSEEEKQEFKEADLT